MEQNDRGQVVGGLMWTYLERIAAQLVSLLVTIKLARILSPTEYGTIAIVTIFTELANVLVVNGFGTALVQKKDSDSTDFSTVFFASEVITWCMYGLLIICAPLIAAFYKMPQLTPILRVLGLQMPIAGISSIQQAYITKRMEFRKFFFSTIIGTIISAVVGIWMARAGYGVWALVAQLLTNRIIDTTILSITSGWRLTREFSRTALKTLFSYSWKVSASSFLIAFYDNIRGLVVGKKYTAEDLAFYNKGRQFPNLIAGNVNTSISKVLFPVLSNVQNDKERVLAMTRRAIKESSYILTPFLFGLAACAEPFVRVILTDKWLPCVPYLQLMCLIYALQPMQTASIQAMKAIGRSDTYLKLEIIKKSINICILLVSLFAFHSVLIVAVGALISELVSTIANVPANRRLIGYSYKDQLLDCLLPLTLSVVMCVGVFLLGRIGLAPLPTLALQIITGAAVYIILSVVFHIENFYYALHVLTSIVHRGGRK